MCAVCIDLVDPTYSDGLSMSRDDLKFMNIVADSVVQCEGGDYQVSLPLRNRNVKCQQLGVKLNEVQVFQ